MKEGSRTARRSNNTLHEFSTFLGVDQVSQVFMEHLVARIGICEGLGSIEQLPHRRHWRSHLCFPQTVDDEFLEKVFLPCWGQFGFWIAVKTVPGSSLDGSSLSPERQLHPRTFRG